MFRGVRVLFEIRFSSRILVTVLVSSDVTDPEAHLVTGVVGMAGEDRQGAVDLLGEYDAGKLMRQGQTAKGQKKVGALTCHGGPSIGGTDSEHEALSALIADAPNLRGELLRGVLLAAAIQQDGVGGGAAGLAVQPVENCCLGVEELGVAGDVPGSALDIVGE